MTYRGFGAREIGLIHINDAAAVMPAIQVGKTAKVPSRASPPYCSVSAASSGRNAMKRLDDRTAAHLEVVLEDACRVLPHGGDHSFRKRIALKLLGAARHGDTTLDHLTSVARAAAIDAMKRRGISAGTYSKAGP
jgi:hypothetical protein